MKYHHFVDLFRSWILLSTLVTGSILEEELQHHLFKNYNKHVRPSKKVNDIITVHFFLTLSQVISVAEKSEELTTSQYITLRWQDERLSWDPKDFDNILTLRLPSSIFWKPDIALSNNIDVDFDRTVPVNALLNHTGVVEWLPPAIYRSSCSIQVEYFPFDWQNCSLRFQSFTYSKSEILLVSVYNKVVVDKEAYTDNGEWNVIHCPVRVNNNSEDPEYQDITLYLIMQRKPLFYIINIIFPCILISSLSVLVFYLPSGCSEKTNMSISVLLGLPVYLLLLAKRVPETSIGIPLIGAYLLFTMLTVTLSVIFSVIVINIHHRSPATSVMASWMKLLFIEFLPPLLFINVPILPTINIDDDEDDSAIYNAEEKTTSHRSPKSDLGSVLYSDIEWTNSWKAPKSKSSCRTELKNGSKNVLTKSILKRSCRKRKWSRQNRAISRTEDLKIPSPRIRYSINDNAESTSFTTYQPDLSNRRIYVSNSPELSVPENLSFYVRKACNLKTFPELTPQSHDLTNHNNCVLREASATYDSNVTFSSKLVPEGLDNKVRVSDSSNPREYFKLSCDLETKQEERDNEDKRMPSSPISHSYFDITPTSRETSSYQVHSYDFKVEPNLYDCLSLSESLPKQVPSTSTYHINNKEQPRIRKKKIVRRTGECMRNKALVGEDYLPRVHDQGDAEPPSRSVHFDQSIQKREEKIDDSCNNRRDDYQAVREVIHRFPSEASGCLKAVNFICQHVMDQNNYKAKAGEWKVVAMVLDRLLFWIFLLIYIAGSLYFAIQALTNFPPNHPFVAGDPKYAKCWEGPSDHYLQSKFSWNG